PRPSHLFPYTTLFRSELQFAADPSVQAKGYVIAAHTQKFPPVAAPTLRFEPAPYETFDESADLYKDGSVIVVPLRGHTPGSVGRSEEHTSELQSRENL